MTATPTSYGGPLEIAPGSIRRVTEDDLIVAWRTREDDREGFLDTFRHAIYSFRKGDMTDILGVSRDELDDALAPRISAEMQKALLDAEQIENTADRRAAVDTIIASLRKKGWHLSEIGKVYGIGRQAALARNPSGLASADPALVARIDPPRRIRAVSLGTIPKYAFDADLAPVSISEVPEVELDRLVALARAYEEVPRTDTKERAKRGKKVADTAMDLHRKYDISLSRLALNTGYRGNRHYFARICRSHGYPEAHLPESLN